jgi:hypothetical protein
VKRRSGFVLALAMVGGCALSACSSSPSSSSSTTTTSASTSTSRPANTTSTGASSSTSSTSAGTARCATASLSGAIAGSSGGAGTIETTVALKSTASTTCVLGGYPGLLLLSSAGAALPTNVVRKGSYSFTSMAPTTVTLAPGQSTYFNIGYSDVPVGTETTCPSSASLEVTPPNATDHLVIAATMEPCGGGTLVVSPVFASTGSASQTTAPPTS